MSWTDDITAMLIVMIGSVFPVLYLCGAAIMFIKFRKSAAGIVGGVGFLIWFAVFAARTVLLQLGFDIVPQLYLFNIISLCAFVIVLVALATVPVGRAKASASASTAPGVRPDRPRSVTVISILLIALAAVALIAIVVTAVLIEFDERFMLPLLAILAAAVLQAVLGVAMLGGHNWARWTFLIVSPVSFAAALLSGNATGGAIVQVVFYVIAAYFLTRPEAVAFFRPGTAAPADPMSAAPAGDLEMQAPPPGQASDVVSETAADTAHAPASHAHAGHAASAPETARRLADFRWVSGEENPASRNVECSLVDQMVRFECPTCAMPVSCSHDQIHGLVGAMVECTHCGNISHVPATCLYPDEVNREPLRACVFVPVTEFPAWYYAHPQCRDADPSHEALYGLWTYCAGCKHEYTPSVLFSYSMSDSAGGMVFNANSPESARDFEALQKGHCPICNDQGLLALRLQIPPRVMVEIEDHLRKS